MSNMTTSVIQEGDQVVFRREGSTRVFQIRKKRQVYFEKSRFDVDELIGQPYGSTFEIDGDRLKKVNPSAAVQLPVDEITSEPGADNRNLLDVDSNQRMTKEDIMKRKEEGITGKELISELIENSETFKTKTEFSQEKYLKKKKQKHVIVFTVLRPTPRLVLEIFAKEPLKICYLRADSLSQLLNYSNVQHGSNVGIVETCQGLVLACLLQRMGGKGKLIQFIPNENNAVCRQVVEYFNFPKEYWDQLYSFPLDKLSTLCEPTPADSKVEKNPSTKPEESEEISGAESLDKPDVSESGAAEMSSQDSDSCTAEGSGNVQELDLPEDSNVTEPGGKDEEKGGTETREEQTTKGAKAGKKRRLGPIREAQVRQRALRQKEAGDCIRTKQLDSLVLACKYNPEPILMKMLEFMSPSRPVVVFCQYLEPLVDCYKRIKEKHVGLQLKLSETWFREYQVLPERTHPKMNMSGNGGFLLTFMSAEPGPSTSTSGQ